MSSRSVLLFFAVSLVVGCAHTMSVEEAKQLTTSFTGTSLIAPPRTIADITAILDQSRVMAC
jgi:hypothetical protein